MNCNQVIETESTSLVTSKTNTILLSRSESYVQVYFEAQIVDNTKTSDQSVSGKIVYDKKKKAEDFDDPERLSKREIRVGQMMEINLSVEETYKLYKGLEARYALFGETGIEFGKKKYLFFEVDDVGLYKFITGNESILRQIVDNAKADDLIQVLELISSSNLKLDMLASLKKLGTSKIGVIENKLNFAKLDLIMDIWESNRMNSSEEFWQEKFTENGWVISQIFSIPMTFLGSKMYLGGKSINNSGGNIVDFLYKNQINNNIAVIEIKTPTTELVGSQYRNTYRMGGELTGSVSQVLNYRDSFLKEYNTLGLNNGDKYSFINPKSIIIIGMLVELSDEEQQAFDNYRNELKSIEIITFDELFLRIENLRKLFAGDKYEL